MTTKRFLHHIDMAGNILRNVEFEDNSIPASKISGLGSGGAGEGGAAPAAVRTTATVQRGLGQMVVGKSVLFLHLAATAVARIRLYSSVAARVADAPRGATTPPPAHAGLILEFITTAELLQAALAPAVIASNLESPVKNLIYYHVESMDPSATVQFTYLPMEA